MHSGNLYVAVEKINCQKYRDKLEALNLYDASRKLKVVDCIFNLPVLELTQEQLSSIEEIFANNSSCKIVQLDHDTGKDKVISPANIIKNEVSNIMKNNNLGEDVLLEEIPKSWQIHGDLVLLGCNSFQSKDWDSVLGAVLDCICSVLNVNRVARKNSVVDDSFRSPKTDMLRGNDGWVSHKDNGITYSWDLTRCMFSIGNISEKLRVARFNCAGEVVVDLFAGIGYFTLPYLVHAKATHVFACEWNPSSVEALRYNLKQAGVAERCTVLQGDNREISPVGVADRINLGLIPCSSMSWATACKALKPSGGVMHVHANVETRTGTDKRESWREWVEETSKKFRSLLEEIHKSEWSVVEMHLECVKSYAPRIHHVVLDIRCLPLD